jgi:hypothetical protein
MSKRTSYGKIYCLNVLARPYLPRRGVFTHGWVFTVHADGKQRVRADAALHPRGQWRGRADHLTSLPLALPRTPSLALRRRADASARTLENK